MYTPATRKGRLIAVSNRLPIVVTRADNGEWQIEPGDGGLINALAPVLRGCGGVWIGWPGTVEEDQADISSLLLDATSDSGYALEPISLSSSEHDKFYLGFSNEIIWPLFHDLQTRCNFDPTYWATYEAVNRKFAQAIAQSSRADDYIWVHDYHLINVASELRALGITNAVSFFLHIPFPSPDILLKLPWRLQILRALLDYDLIGFQTMRDRGNFVQCVRELLEDVTIHEGKGPVISARLGERTVRIGTFPVGIDFQTMAQQAASPAVADAAHHIQWALPDRTMIFSTDRLDYTKGIPEKLAAFRHALLQYPQLQERVTLVQAVVPSRTDIREYAALKAEVEQLVGEINGQFTRAGWVPIHYIYHRLTQTELLAYYRSSAIALITPLKDGMNLVAKEYCACGQDDGVLILSEFAGAAAQLPDALLVNPYDRAGVAEAIYQAWTMSQEQRRARMRNLRRAVRERDIFWWVDSCLQAETTNSHNTSRLLEQP